MIDADLPALVDLGVVRFDDIEIRERKAMVFIIVGQEGESRILHLDMGIENELVPLQHLLEPVCPVDDMGEYLPGVSYVMRQDGRRIKITDKNAEVAAENLEIGQTVERQLTDGDFNHQGPLSWSPDGARIFFSANRDADWEYEAIESDIYSIDAIGARAAGLVPILLDPTGGYADVDCATIATLEALLV